MDRDAGSVLAVSWGVRRCRPAARAASLGAAADHQRLSTLVNDACERQRISPDRSTLQVAKVAHEAAHALQQAVEAGPGRGGMCLERLQPLRQLRDGCNGVALRRVGSEGGNFDQR